MYRLVEELVIDRVGLELLEVTDKFENGAIRFTIDGPVFTCDNRLDFGNPCNYQGHKFYPLKGKDGVVSFTDKHGDLYLASCLYQGGEVKLIRILVRPKVNVPEFIRTDKLLTRQDVNEALKYGFEARKNGTYKGSF